MTIPVGFPEKFMAGTPLWASVTPTVWPNADGSYDGLHRVASGRLDARPLLAALFGEKLLNVLTPGGLHLTAGGEGIKSTEQGSEPWGETFNFYDYVQDSITAAAAGRGDPPAFLNLLDGENPGEVTNLHIVLDDLVAGWEWVIAHRWHRLVASAFTQSVHHPAYQTIVPTPLQAVVAPRWEHAAAWVVEEAPELLEDSEWVTQIVNILVWNEVKQRNLPQQALWFAVSLTNYLVGTNIGDPLMGVRRAVSYTRADIGASEARQLEFGPPENRPSLEALKLLGGLHSH